MLRRRFVSTSATVAPRFSATTTGNSALLASAYRFYLPGTDKGVIKSPLPSVMDKINAETSLWAQYTNAAKKYGDKTAFVCGVSGRTRTFTEAYQRTLRYAETMQHGMGIVSGDVIVLMSPNCLDYPCIFYAAMAVGATICPVNPLCTPEELQRTITAAGNVKAVFTLDPFKATVATALGLLQANKSAEVSKDVSKKADILPQTFLFADSLELPAGLPNIKEVIHKLDDTAVLPFSSGTTGTAKGVQLTNYSILSNIIQTEQTLNLSQDETFMSVLPFFHIYGMTVCMAMGWVHGSKQIVLPKFDLEAYLKLVGQFQPTHLFVAPPMFLGFLKAPVPNKKELFASVKRVISGAAPLGEQLQQQAESLFSDKCKISQGYGMTEASPVVTVSCPSVEGAPGEHKKYGHVGCPLADTDIRVVDPATEKDVDEFYTQAGELWIRGPQIMKGYLKKEDTDKVLVEGGWYRSGDIGVVNKDFTFTITDRIKEMIKVSGMQIAPAEIEAVLQHHPKINEAVVVGLPTTDGSGTELPYAQVALKPDVVAELGDDAAKKKALEEEIKQYVHDHLSYYKQLKGGVDFVAAVPKSPTGKLLRRIPRDMKVAELKKQQ